MLEDGRGLGEGVIGRDAAVRPDFEEETVIIGALADAGVFDGVADARDGEKSESMAMTPMV